MNKRNIRRFAELGFAMTAIAVLVAGCGGSSTPATTLTGKVADGYLSNVKVCQDKNGNSVCDAGEYSALTDANGAYSLVVEAAGATDYPIIAEVPADSVDSDTGAAVGQAFTLTAPAGSSFVSPLTTLVQDKIAAGATPASAVASVEQALDIPAASGVSALDDYVELKGNATDQTNGYFRAHEAAKTVAEVLKAGKVKLGDTSASTDQATQSALIAEANNVLLAQAVTNVATPAALFSPATVNANSLAGAGTLKSVIAANKAASAAATQAVTINFDVVNGATAVGINGCVQNSLTLGTANTVGSLRDLRFYVSNVALIDASGNYVPVVMDSNANQDSNVALIDFEDASGGCGAAGGVTTGSAETYTAIVGNVAPGTYQGISLTIGVPENLNHLDTVANNTPAVLQNIDMNWSWQSGRKFTKIEFTPNAGFGGKTVTTMVHLGSTDCKALPENGEVPNGCGSPNRMLVSFANFDPATQKIALDLSALLGDLDLTTKKTWMSGKTDCFPAPWMGPGAIMCMGGSASNYFDKFQIDLNTGLPINDGAAQTLFIVE